MLNSEHNKKCSCDWGIEWISFNYYEKVVFRVKVLFCVPVVHNCPCHTWLLVSRCCCCEFSSLTIVLTDLSGTQVSPPHCHTLSGHLMDPVNVGSVTMYCAPDILFSLQIRLLTRSRVLTTFPVESPCLTDSYHHMCAAKWRLPSQRS